MAEAIGLVASVVQLAGTGLKLSQALYQYAEGVANADRRIREVAKEIKLTSCVIEELGNVFKQDDTLNLISKSAIATANETLKECSTLFGEIETTLSKSRKGKMGRLMLPFRESKMELLRSHIDKLKSTLQLLMQVLLHAHQVASNKIDREAEARQRDEIRQLLEEKKNTTKKYEESLRTFAASDSSTEVEDDMFSLSDKGSASMFEVKSIGSTMDPDSLTECMEHVRTLLENMERLQQALAKKSGGDDHSSHYQTAIESYFATRFHLDRILLGSSNTTNLTGTVFPIREPASNKASTLTSESKFCAVEKEKQEASLSIETSTINAKPKRRPGMSNYSARSSSQRTVLEQVSTGASFRSQAPPVIQGNVYGNICLPFGPPPTVGPSTYGPSTVDSDITLHSSPMSPCDDSRSLRPQNISSVSPAELPARDESLRWIVGGAPADFKSRDTMRKVRKAAMASHRKTGKSTEEIVASETVKIARIKTLPQYSEYNAHGPGSQTSGEKREDTLGGKANDLPEAASEGNDEVDKLLREWTTCFS